MIQPKASIRPDCFAFGNSSKSGCRALIKLECKDCRFFKTNDEFKRQNYACQARLNEIKLKGSDKVGN